MFQGSPFKLLVALTALQEKAITPKTNIICTERYVYGKNKRVMQCHCGGGYRNLDSGLAIRVIPILQWRLEQLLRNTAMLPSRWISGVSHIKSFGLGNFLGNDLSVGKKGNIPDGSLL